MFTFSIDELANASVEMIVPANAPAFVEFALTPIITIFKFFIVELEYCGVVSLNIPDEHVDAVLKIEVPHMLFPYARQAISGVLMDAGLPPLMLNPIDFVAMYHANKKSEAN